MSQERTRFPIQPDERRRSARSSDNIKAVPDEMPEPDEAPPDKPRVPPHERGERDTVDRGDEGETGDDGTEDR